MNRQTNILASLAALILAGAQGQAAEPAKVENVSKISAKVEAVDQKKRLVSLRGPNGVVTIEVAPEVRNLAQVKVGDELVVSYHESLAAVIKPKGTSTTLNSVDQGVAAARAAPGEKPGASLGSVQVTTVVIQSVDKSRNSVTFSGHDGFVRVVEASRPEGKKFVQTLKKGDEVELTYTEAAAISIEPAKAAEPAKK